jgi:outer membrane protein TolC
MKTQTMILTAAAMLVAAAPVFQSLALAADDNLPELTLEQVLTLARKRNKSLVAERARLLQAQASVEQAWASLFPTVAAQGKYTRNNTKFEFGRPIMDPVTGVTTGVQNLRIQPLDQFDGAVSATLPLIAPAAYPALQAVKLTEKGAEAGFEVSDASVLLSVAQLFYAASIADEVFLARQSNVSVANATMKNARVRFQAGTVTKVDVDRAELALVQAEQAVREAAFGQQKTYRALATLIQRQEPFRVRAPAIPAERHDENELQMALHLRPEFRALEFNAQSADAQRRANGWRWAPTLSAFGNARIFNYDNFAAQHHAWAFGAQLDWVLFEGGTRDALRHIAAAQAEEAAARADVLRDTIRDDLADGRRNLETKQQGLAVAERSVTLAMEALGLVRVQYEAGTVTQVDLLQAQDALVGAQVGLAQAHYDVAAADLALRHAAGTFPPK